MSGDTATTVRPCPLVAANTDPAAVQIAWTIRERGGRSGRDDRPGGRRGPQDIGRFLLRFDGVLLGEIVDDHVKDRRAMTG